MKQHTYRILRRRHEVQAREQKVLERPDFDKVVETCKNNLRDTAKHGYTSQARVAMRSARQSAHRTFDELLMGDYLEPSFDKEDWT